jgi:predicted nucleotidyltransferase
MGLVGGAADVVTQEQIQAVSEKIAREFAPEKIILFGSYAYGTPTEDSDVDLLVVLPYEGSSAQKAAEILYKVHAGFPLDLLAYPPDYIRRRIVEEDCFLREVTGKGKTLYEAPHSRVGR